MVGQIAKELKSHAPFTLFGALTGVVMLVLFQSIPHHIAFNTFYILHPIHVVLSALVTTSMYQTHKSGHGRYNLLALLMIGFIGSIGIATISDSLIPYLGEAMLSMPNRGLHIGFIEKWWLINPLALLGIAIAYFRPATKVPHAGHVLLSTWASLFHILMAVGGPVNWLSYLIVFAFLFVAVVIPCCVSDIVFPLLFVGKK
ncbi:MAG: hypothetical protein JRE40_05950 [Deltaproteobacteria bacterium]|nr:hypothetical protein [Deltaproteobacteria bacterium]MBW2674129.1 hypothetical protein [Deltaproteobacteria bacterium]